MLRIGENVQSSAGAVGGPTVLFVRVHPLVHVELFKIHSNWQKITFALDSTHIYNVW